MSGAGINEAIREMHVGDKVSSSNWNNVAAFVNRASQMNKSEDAIYDGCGQFVIPKLGYFNIFNGDASNTIPPYGIAFRNGVSTNASPPLPQVKQPDSDRLILQNDFFIAGDAEIPPQAYGVAQTGDGNLFIAQWDPADGTPVNGQLWGPLSGGYLLRASGPGFVIVGIYDSTNNYAYVTPTTGVDIYNGDAGNTIPRYGVVIRSGIFNEVPQVQRSTVYGCQQNFFVNGLGSIAGHAYGKAQLAIENLYIAAYDSSTGTPAFGAQWGVISGSYLLSKKGAGFIVEGIYDSTNHYALVRSVPMLTVRGQVGSDITTGGNGTLTVWTGAFGSETTTSLTIPNVQNNSSCTVKASKMCTAKFVPDNGGWEFIAAFSS